MVRMIVPPNSTCINCGKPVEAAMSTFESCGVQYEDVIHVLQVYPGTFCGPAAPQLNAAVGRRVRVQ